MVKVIILSTPKERQGNIYRISKRQWERMGFATRTWDGLRYPVRSQIVMRNWQRFFQRNESGYSYANMQNDDLIIAESDVDWLMPLDELRRTIDMNDYNYLCYQKLITKNVKGLGGNIKATVGAQAFYIPKEKVNDFSNAIEKARPQHFDAWLSQRLLRPPYQFKPKEHCAEFTSKSATTGKMRPGKEVDRFAITRKEPVKKQVKKYMFKKKTK